MDGPCEEASVCTSNAFFGFGDDVGPEGSELTGIVGGGSMTGWDSVFPMAGSGNAAKLSSADDVSIVMCFVCGGDFRGVK